jgi:hypothetical protein
MKLPKVHVVIDFNGPRVCLYPEMDNGELTFNAAYRGSTFKGVTKMLLRDDFKVTLFVAPVDKFGNPATIDGAAVWASSDETVATVVPSADSLSCDVLPVGKVGSVQISATADADMGDGIKPVSGTIDIEVVAGETVSMGVAAGAPVPNP